MKIHYFKEGIADTDDTLLQLCIKQGYVPKSCLLGGMIVWDEVNKGRDACSGCASPREKCHGREMREVKPNV